MTRPIDVPYAPADVVGEFGWLWSPLIGDEPGEWEQVETVDLDLSGQLVTRFVRHSPDADGDIVQDADQLAGLPYLPLSPPACEPGAGLLVTIRAAGGATISHAWVEPGEDADHAERAVALALALAPPEPQP